VANTQKRRVKIKRNRFIFQKGFLCYRWQWYLTHPWEIFQQLWQEIFVMFERGIYGFARRDTWNLGNHYINVMVESLKYFKPIVRGYPVDLTEKQWDEILEQLAIELEFYTTEEFFDMYGDAYLEQMKKFKKTWNLLGKHMFQLWD